MEYIKKIDKFIEDLDLINKPGIYRTLGGGTFILGMVGGSMKQAIVGAVVYTLGEVISTYETRKLNHKISDIEKVVNEK